MAVWRERGTGGGGFLFCRVSCLFALVGERQDSMAGGVRNSGFDGTAVERNWDGPAGTDRLSRISVPFIGGSRSPCEVCVVADDDGSCHPDLSGDAIPCGPGIGYGREAKPYLEGNLSDCATALRNLLEARFLACESGNLV